MHSLQHATGLLEVWQYTGRQVYCCWHVCCGTLLADLSSVTSVHGHAREVLAGREFCCGWQARISVGPLWLARCRAVWMAVYEQLLTCSSSPHGRLSMPCWHCRGSSRSLADVNVVLQARVASADVAVWHTPTVPTAVLRRAVNCQPITDSGRTTRWPIVGSVTSAPASS
jgi:hypothetical protein